MDDRPAPDAPDSRASLAIRFVDEHSGRNDLLGAVASFEAMANVVSKRLEGSKAGSRFPLLRLVGRREPLSAIECEALAREVTRLRSVLAPLPASAIADGRDEGSRDDSALGAPTAVREIFRRLNGDGAPRTLAEAFGWPLFVLEHIARLGAASRRGARFEIGDPDAFAPQRTPLNPHEAFAAESPGRDRARGPDPAL